MREFSGETKIAENEPLLTGEMETGEKDWEELRQAVKDFYEKDSKLPPKTVEVFLEHNKQVEDFVRECAAEEGFGSREMEIAVLAGILHDIAKGSAEFERHGEAGGEKAEELLIGMGKSPELALSVKLAITRHMGQRGYPSRLAKEKYGEEFQYPKYATDVGRLVYECDILTQLTGEGIEKILHLRETDEKNKQEDARSAAEHDITLREAALLSVLSSAEESFGLIEMPSVKKKAEGFWEKIREKYSECFEGGKLKKL